LVSFRLNVCRVFRRSGEEGSLISEEGWPMEPAGLRRAAAVAVAATALLHVYVGLIELEEYFGEVRYLGALFLLGAAGGFTVAAQLWYRGDRVAWVLGAVIAGGMAVGFILSRTTGLTDLKEVGKWEPEGLLSLLLEGVYLGLFAAWMLRRRAPAVAQAATAP
jgi:hypothetical protein